jgi:hypothetical protein
MISQSHTFYNGLRTVEAETVRYVCGAVKAMDSSLAANAIAPALP